jgi:hypothetical protein
MISTMNEPTLTELPQFARRGQVRAWLGISQQAMTKLVRAGVLNGRTIAEGGYLVYNRDELLAAARSGVLCPPAAGTPTRRKRRF